MNSLSTVILLLASIGFARSAVAAPVEDALGAFTSQTPVLPGTSRACFLKDDAAALLLRPGRDIRMISLSDPDDEVLVVDGDYTAITTLDDGSWLTFDAEGGHIVRCDSPSSAVPGILALQRSAPLQDGVDPFTDVVALEPHTDGVLVVERGAHRVRLIGWDGTERLRLGGKGSEDGRFHFPVDVAVAEDGRIHVVDRDNHRIQTFEADGTWVRSWGGRGAFPGLLAAPSSIDVEGGLLYVGEELNHRISVFAPAGRFLYQWGMHPVVPRQGDGAIHYPLSVDIGADGTRALVAEPFERRIQLFERFPGGITEARSQPMPSKESILSHFGRFLAADEDLLAMWEPESGSVLVFDMTGETGINITVFSNHGTGWDDIGRLGAMHVDADTEEFVVSDLVNDRLQRWRLDRGESDFVKYDPFMARLVSAVDLERTRSRLQVIDPDRDWRTPRIEAFGRARADDAPLLAADTANGVVLALDDELDPIAVVTGCTDPIDLVPADQGVFLVESDGSVVRIDEDGTTMVRQPTDGVIGGAAFLAGDAGTGRFFSTSTESDRLGAHAFDSGSIASEPDEQWGGTGDADGRFHAPSGLGLVSGERIVIVDQGNHRAQIFSPEGDWLSTFSLSSGYTTPRRKAAEEPAPLEEDTP